MPESIRRRPLFSTTRSTMPYVPGNGYRARIHTVAPPRAFLNSAWGRLVAAEEIEPISRRPHDTSGQVRRQSQPSPHRLLCDRRQCRDPACMVLHSPPPPLSFVSLPGYDTTLRKPSYAEHGRKAEPNRLRRMPSFEDGRALARRHDERSKSTSTGIPVLTGADLSLRRRSLRRPAHSPSSSLSFSSAETPRTTPPSPNASSSRTSYTSHTSHASYPERPNPILHGNSRPSPATLGTPSPRSNTSPNHAHNSMSNYDSIKTTPRPLHRVTNTLPPHRHDPHQDHPPSTPSTPSTDLRSPPYAYPTAPPHLRRNSALNAGMISIGTTSPRPRPRTDARAAAASNSDSKATMTAMSAAAKRRRRHGVVVVDDRERAVRAFLDSEMGWTGGLRRE